MESPFYQQLHTNYVPTDFEVECIRTQLASPSQELLRLESLIVISPPSASSCLKGLTLACLSDNLRILLHLQTLTMDGSKDARGAPLANVDEQLVLLTPENGSLPMCPQLEELRIRRWSPPRDTELDLLRFTQRRLECTAHFSHLDVRYAKFTPNIPETLLRPFRERGLHITTTSPLIRPVETLGPWSGLITVD
ncbi:hypothetical protein C8R44DRAFT_894816 [Mycena epipterygia]|nr:hypothetical protein C8R44DRAFT_894816 [Mycena epipterygia]